MTPHKRTLPFSLLHLALAAGTAIGLAGAAKYTWRAEPPRPARESSAPRIQLSTFADDTPADAPEIDADDPGAPATTAAAPAPAAQAPADAPPATPTSALSDSPAAPAAQAVQTTPDGLPLRDAQGRIIRADEPTKLAFKNVPVDQLVPYIMEATGKVVLPMPDVMTPSLRITVLNDQKISQIKALDMVFLALLYNGVAVIETQDTIFLRSIAELDKGEIPVVRGSVMDRSPGTIVQKVFTLEHGSASNIADMFKTQLPSYAKMTFDPDSNQVVVTADVGFLQRMEKVITALDQPSTASLSTETFHLKFSDSDSIAQNIRDLYSPQQGQNRNGQQNAFQAFFNRGGQGGGGRAGAPGAAAAQPAARTATADAATSQNLRVTSNSQQNAVTVLAEKPVLDQIRKQIETEWDVKTDAIAPRVYELKNTDPVKMRDTLISVFGSPGAARQSNQATGTAANRLYGQFAFETIPESSKLIVIAKNQANLEEIDKIIMDLDKPQSAGLPQIIELKHADAEQLAEQLNALLSREGTLATVTKSQTGLTTSATAQSPFATAAATAAASANPQNQQLPAYTYWWQRSQPSTTTAGSGNLVGKIRIIPVWRQNSLLVLAPPEYRDSLTQVIQSLDERGRQVLITAVVAEITIEDDFAVGLRWGSTTITPSKSENSVSFGPSTAGTAAGGTITGQQNDLLPGFFTSSVLNLGVNVNALVQALAEKSAVNILSEPRIFTSDNQEAEFFSGQDIPFITESQPNTQGNLVQSFDYRAVGIALRVRPRITINKDVDLDINLELSSTQPGNTLFGGAIVDRRETTTHLILGDGQTVVVSGILRNEDSDTKRKVPFLGDLPLVGPAFNSVERTRTKTELIAFVTPYVLGSETDIMRVDEKDRERLDQVRHRLEPTNSLDLEKGKEKKPGASAAGESPNLTGEHGLGEEPPPPAPTAPTPPPPPPAAPLQAPAVAPSPNQPK